MTNEWMRRRRRKDQLLLLLHCSLLNGIENGRAKREDCISKLAVRSYHLNSVFFAFFQSTTKQQLFILIHIQFYSHFVKTRGDLLLFGFRWGLVRLVDLLVY